MIKLFLFLMCMAFQSILINSYAQNVGVVISETLTSPAQSAMLDVHSTNKGLLLPRLTQAEIDAISAPIPESLLLFNTTTECYQAYNAVTSSWVNTSCLTSISFPCQGTVIPVIEVTSFKGKVWMDRNLGASQVATSSSDAASYGDLYQWGRCSDGHEKRTSGTTATPSGSDTPGHGDFITSSNLIQTWQNTPNPNLWQGVVGINNPCPTGFRLPTEAELTEEHISWFTQNAAGALASPLKLSLTGRRWNETGLLDNVNLIGFYASSTFSGPNSVIYMEFQPNFASTGNTTTGRGLSVRCIKN